LTVECLKWLIGSIDKECAHLETPPPKVLEIKDMEVQLFSKYLKTTHKLEYPCFYILEFCEII